MSFCTGLFQTTFDTKAGRHVTEFCSHQTHPSKEKAVEMYEQIKLGLKFAGSPGMGSQYPVPSKQCEYCKGSVRYAALTGMKDRYPWKKKLNQLKPYEHDRLVSILMDHDHLSKDEFAHQINRYWLGKERPKNWTLIDEILINVNSHVQ